MKSFLMSTAIVLGLWGTTALAADLAVTKKRSS